MIVLITWPLALIAAFFCGVGLVQVNGHGNILTALPWVSLALLIAIPARRAKRYAKSLDLQANFHDILLIACLCFAAFCGFFLASLECGSGQGAGSEICLARSCEDSLARMRCDACSSDYNPFSFFGRRILAIRCGTIDAFSVFVVGHAPYSFPGISSREMALA